MNLTESMLAIDLPVPFSVAAVATTKLYY